MKVRVTATIDVDVAAWCLAYGTKAADVADDVRNYGSQIVADHFQSLGLLRAVPDGDGQLQLQPDLFGGQA